MTPFGWCLTGHHPKCPVERFKIVTVDRSSDPLADDLSTSSRQASDGKTNPTETEEIDMCSCTCHTKGTNR